MFKPAIFSVIQDFKIPSNTTLKTPLVAVFDDLDIEVEEEDELKARGKIILLCNTPLYATVHFFRKLYHVNISKSRDDQKIITKISRNQIIGYAFLKKLSVYIINQGAFLSSTFFCLFIVLCIT